MHMLARRQDRSLQAPMAEAFNDVLRKYGESPIGEMNGPVPLRQVAIT